MLDDFLLFIEIVRRGSFSKASADLGQPTSTLSRRLKSLEERLGGALLNRSARGLTLTSFGQQLFDNHAESALTLNAALANENIAEQGHFYLLCPQNLTLSTLYPAIERFHERHTNLTLHVEAQNHNVLLSQKQWDLAVRIGEQRDSSFFQKRLGSIAVALIKRKDCQVTDCFVTPYTKTQLYSEQLECIESSFNKKVLVNDVSLARKLVESGRGVGLLPMPEIARLSTLSDYEYCHPEPLFLRPIYALWPNSSHPPLATQSMLEELVKVVKNSPQIQGEMLPLV